MVRLDKLVIVTILVGTFIQICVMHNKVDKLLKQSTDGDYQIMLARDTIFVMDKSREVGKFKLEYDKDPLGTMILEDNQ